jgi:hypothetical protein
MVEVAVENLLALDRFALRVSTAIAAAAITATEAAATNT